MRLRDLLREWLGVDAGVDQSRRRESRRTARALAGLQRQVEELRGLVHHQSELTVEALHRAGWQSDEEFEEHAGLQRALRAITSDDEVLVGPWTGEVGFELMYWIPFLNWLVEQGLDGRRLIVISRGGSSAWYRHLTSRYLDVLDLMSPEEFRQRTAEAKRKQYSPKRELDRDLIERIRSSHNLQGALHVHPSAMFRLFTSLWHKRATMDLVDSFTVYRRLEPLKVEQVASGQHGLPDGYVAAKFYFNASFPDTADNRAFVTGLLRRVSRDVPVALMSTAVRLDDHADFQATGASGLHVIETHQNPATNLERQTEIIAGARGFVGTYGGFSYLAPFYGVRSLSFFSRRSAFKTHHLELADRVFDRLLPGGFLALDCRAAEMLDPAVARWTAAPAEALPHAAVEEVDAVG